MGTRFTRSTRCTCDPFVNGLWASFKSLPWRPYLSGTQYESMRLLERGRFSLWMSHAVQRIGGMPRQVCCDTSTTDVTNIGFSYQTEIGDRGCVVPLLLYADKTTVSSFNGRTFHPVIARMGNLPAAMRNGQRHGGGFLVAYIPKVRTRLGEMYRLTQTLKSLPWRSLKRLTRTKRAPSSLGIGEMSIIRCMKCFLKR